MAFLLSLFHVLPILAQAPRSAFRMQLRTTTIIDSPYALIGRDNSYMAPPSVMPSTSLVNSFSSAPWYLPAASHQLVPNPFTCTIFTTIDGSNEKWAGWCSWLSRILNTDKVLGSNPSLVIYPSHE